MFLLSHRLNIGVCTWLAFLFISDIDGHFAQALWSNRPISPKKILSVVRFQKECPLPSHLVSEVPKSITPYWARSVRQRKMRECIRKLPSYFGSQRKYCDSFRPNTANFLEERMGILGFITGGSKLSTTGPFDEIMPRFLANLLLPTPK